MKFLALLAIAIHWYNPICYLLYQELCVVCEMDCDYGVIKGVDDAQRQRYSQLILELASVSSGKKDRFAVGLVNNDAATFKRRISEMKKTRKNIKIGLSCIVMAVICIAGTVTAFAYAPLQKHTLSNFNEEGEIIFSVPDNTENAEQFAFDYFFTDKEGHVVPLDNLPSKISCIHEYVEGQTTKHIKNSNGGCTVIVKSAKRCKYCGYTIEGGIISETKYTVCPH